MSRIVFAAVPVLLLLAGCSAQPVASPPSAACEQSFKDAAAVPNGESAGEEFAATLDACDTVANWGAMLQKYPAVGAVPEITDAEVPLYLKLDCSQLPDAGKGNAICDEARASGFIDE